MIHAVVDTLLVIGLFVAYYYGRKHGGQYVVDKQRELAELNAANDRADFDAISVLTPEGAIRKRPVA